jgi:membrane fusion protein, multidrug efflux system
MISPDTATSPVRHSGRLRHWVVGLVLLALGAAGVAYWSRGSATPTPQRRGRFASDQPTPVRVVPVKTGTIEVELRGLGTVTPLQTVTVRSRLDGQLVKVLFTEGQRVKAGQLLAQIDSRPYEVQLSQAQGQLDEDRARLKNAQGDLASYQSLAAEGLITKQQLTTQEALVQQYGGALQANEATVNNAKLQLSYTRITAPIDGRLGFRQVDAGNLIRAGDANGLVVITQMQPISVLFTVPEADLPSILLGMRQGRELRVEAWDRSEQLKLADGVLETVDNQIDTATGTIKLRARFVNRDETLFPNQFVNIRLRVKSVDDAIVIPSATVQRASFGPFVYVLKDTGTVTVRRVTLGPTQDNRVAVTAGLEPGERVVIEGVDDLTEGAKVEVVTGTDEEQKPLPDRPPASPAQGGRRGGGRR